jgi:hypothetical protein
MTPEGLWRGDAQLVIHDAVCATILRLDGAARQERSAAIVFVRSAPFAALKPFRTREARLGLAVPVEISPRLDPPNVREPWPNRLTAVCRIASVADIDGELERLLQLAWSQS